MTVTAAKPYKFKSSDAVENFGGKQILYIYWEKHNLFSRPMAVCLDPETPFSEIVEKIIPDAYSIHPDFPRIDQSKVEWIKSGKSWRPDPSKSLAQNGLGHKDLIRFVTPGLNGINGMGG